MAQVMSINTSKPEKAQFLPMELATKYYVKWDCDIQIKSTLNGYYKCLEGKGEVQFLNGNKYHGVFRNGLMHGDGVFQWANGLKYTGPFENNSITGSGSYQWLDGSWYKGQLKNGKRHGRGQYFCSKDKSKYNGQWLNGLRDGFGFLQFNEQTHYQGNFQEGLRHGKGKMRYASGNTYEGEWCKDKKNGYGVMNWFTQNQKYEGYWKDDLQHGIGTYYWFDGKIQYKIIKNIYKGNWIHGEREGFGSFFYSNGCRYEGYFEQNLKNNYGLVMDENGNIKLEYFEKDKLVYSIPQSNFVLKNNTAAENNDKKQGQIIKKLVNPKSVPGSIHLQNSSTGKGTKQLPSLSKNSKQNAQGSSSIVKQVQKVFPQSNIPSQKQSKYKIEENIYSKCLDIVIQSENVDDTLEATANSKFFVSKEILNLLLRQNSHLRLWYKYCSLTIASGNSPNAKDFYTGVTIENLFKLVKDLKIMDEYVTIPKINRQFYYEGWKSVYDVVMPNQKKLDMIRKYLCSLKDNDKISCSDWDRYFNNEKVNYSNIQWQNYVSNLHNSSYQSSSLDQDQIDLNTFNEIHNPKKIVLFRHFICYLLKIAFLQTQKLCSEKAGSLKFQKQFRCNLQILFKSIHAIYEAAQRQAKGTHSTDNLTFVSKQRAILSISQEFTKLNSELFHQITKNYQNFHNFSDNTVNVKFLYQMLERFGVLKEPAEKMLFLQKMQRFMENGSKISLLKKQTKQYYGALEKVVYESPYFQRVLNYSLTQKEFQDLLYLAVNRRISSYSKQEAVKKYRQTLEMIINYIKNDQDHQERANKIHKAGLKIKKCKTQKDHLKQQLIEKHKTRALQQQENKRKKLQIQRESLERFKMEKEDFRWEEDQMEQSDEYFD